MDESRWSRVEKLFHDALNVDERVRTEWLRSRCTGDEDLYREVSSLLQYDLPAEEEIRHAISDAAGRLEPAPAGPRIGDHIGPYHLIKEIGRGGMGVVFLAIRTDPQFFQTVAIKLLKREFDASQIAARFLRERQILATLSHPNIAAVLDGGATENGTPYLVMEFISGKPVTLYASEEKLSVRDKVRLFQKICAAVHHAHRNLVIHRDLKPANVLVSTDGEPKLLDFGIAKLIGPELLPLELPPTETQWRLLTPDYASPEQLRGESLTTATDIFSLGILLYELLTGARPFPFETRDPLEWVNTICSQEPVLPSKAPGLSPRDRREIAGDLDHIVLKALRKEPEKRYNSAAQLSDDLDRFLNEEPVAARRGTVFYRLEKLVHRYRLAFAMVLLLIVALAVGMVSTAWQAQRAERRFNELRAFARAVVFDLDDRIRLLPGATDARGALIRTAQQYLDNLAREAGSDPELLDELTRAYRKIGDVQGSPFQPNLGDSAAAERSYRKSLALAERLVRQKPDDIEAHLQLVSSQFSLGRLLVVSGGLPEARGLYEAGRDRAENLAIEYGYDPRVTEMRSRGAMFLGDAFALGFETEKALASYQFALRVLAAADATQEPTMRETALAYARVADATAALGHLRQAVTYYERSIDIRQTLARRSPENDDYQRDLFNAYISLGSLLGASRPLSLHNRKAAKPWFEKATVIAQALATKDPGSARSTVDLAFSSAHLADVIQDEDPERSLRLYRESIRMFDEIVAGSPANVSFRQWQARRYEGIARVLEARGRLGDALDMYQKAMEIRSAVAADEPTRRELNGELASAACSMVRVMHATRHPGLTTAVQVAARHTENLATEQASLASQHQLAQCYEIFGEVSLAGDPPAAGRWFQKARQAWDSWRQVDPGNVFISARFADVERRLAAATKP
jgi:tetratricopeptide (TPR) repeat protein